MNHLSCLQNVSKVFEYPFPHVYVENALPEQVYDELEKNFPENIICQQSPVEGGKAFRYKVRDCVINPPPPIWVDFFGYHTSKEYFYECIKIFEPIIEKKYPQYEHLLSDEKISRRGIDDKGKYLTDCQCVIHEPIDETGTSRTPHMDNPVEIYAGLLYMKHKNDYSVGGNFTLHKQVREIKNFYNNDREIENGLYEEVFQVPYKKNSFCMFLNVPGSIHSVSPRKKPTERRRSVNIIGEYNANGMMWEDLERIAR